MDESWLLFFFVGLLAQLVDGAHQGAVGQKQSIFLGRYWAKQLSVEASPNDRVILA